MSWEFIYFTESGKHSTVLTQKSLHPVECIDSQQANLCVSALLLIVYASGWKNSFATCTWALCSAQVQVAYLLLHPAPACVVQLEPTLYLHS